MKIYVRIFFNFSPSTCAVQEVNHLLSSVQMEPFSINNILFVIGGTTLTVTNNLPSTISTPFLTKNRRDPTARLCSAKMINLLLLMIY